MTTAPTLLHIEQLSHAWQGQALALSDMSLTLQQGELLGLLGPNGAGKTTLVCAMAGLVQPLHGQVEVLGLPTRTHAIALRKHMGFVFQSLSLDRLMSVQDNLLFAGGLHGLSEGAVLDRIAALSTLVPLQPLLNKPVAQLSGGQKRLVDIVRALLHQPQLLVLDEPTTALDPAAKRQVWQLLLNLKNTQQLGILVATHLMDEAQDCDRVLFIQHGKKKWEGTPQQALSEMPNQHTKVTHTLTLNDWFIWKLNSPQADTPHT